MKSSRVLALLVLTVLIASGIVRGITYEYDLVGDFADLAIPAGSSPAAVTQNAGDVWTYQSENIAHNHDGTYTLMGSGWNANYRGYGLASGDTNSDTYPDGANVRAVINANDSPNALLVPDPANTNYLQSWAYTGASFIWEPLVIVWTAPQDGEVVVSILAENTSANDANRVTNLSLDSWDGATLTVLDSVSLAGTNSYTLSASLPVLAGDQIHIWRDAYVTQQGIIAFSGTIALTIPEPASGVLAATGFMLLLRRRRM